jgi:hypothetical protein
LPVGHACDTLLVTAEFDGLVVSTRSIWLTPGGPAGPAAPVAPAGPCGPVGPAGSWPGAKSARTSDRFATFADVTTLFLSFAFVTAPFRSWAVPTLFLGSWLTAATLVPPSATPSAMQARTNAGEGRFSVLRIVYLPGSWGSDDRSGRF